MTRSTSVRISSGMLFPCKQRIELAGLTLNAIEFRVRNVAVLEREAAIARPDIMADLTGRMGEIDAHPKGSPERRRLLIAAFKGRDEWPPRMGARSFGEYLRSPNGACMALWISLKRTNRDLSADDCLRLAEAMSPDEWSAFDRVAWGFQPWEDYSPDDPSAGPGRGMDWGAVAFSLVERGMSFADIGRLYVNQLLAILSDGKPRKVWLKGASSVIPPAPDATDDEPANPQAEGDA